jgi:phenylalanyl-tRNA synthetase beta chain
MEAMTGEDARFAITSAGQTVGGGGVAAPGVVDAPAWASPVYFVEARLPAQVPDKRATRYAPLPTFPASERDLALLVPDSVAAALVEGTVRETAGPLLNAVWPFDLYAGKGVPEGTRSIGFRLRFRSEERTVTDAEVDKEVDRVLRALEERHGVRRR